MRKTASEIVDEYSDMVYRIAFARMKNLHDAQDVFQDAFLKYATSDKLFRDENHLKAWLIRVTINCCNKRFRQPATQNLDTCELPFYQNFNENGKTVFDAVMSLSPKFSSVMYLFYYEDMKIKQIATALKMTESNVKVSLMRARAEVKDALGNDLFGEADYE